MNSWKMKPEPESTLVFRAPLQATPDPDPVSVLGLCVKRSTCASERIPLDGFDVVIMPQRFLKSVNFVF